MADPKPSPSRLQLWFPGVAGADLEDVGSEIVAVFVEAEVAASEAAVSAIVEGSVVGGEDSVAVAMTATGNDRFSCLCMAMV